MNKDVIYIETEDDITDIISKIESSKERIVALVPPKKSDLLRSVINIKLIAKTSKSTNKSVVLVTTDPSIIKLAAVTKLPVTKDLKTAPMIPSEDEVLTESETIKEEVLDNGDSIITTQDVFSKTSDNSSYIEKITDKNIDQEESKESDAQASELQENLESKDETGSILENNKSDNKVVTEDSKNKKPKNRFTKWFTKHRAQVGVSASVLIIIILLLNWAFVIAPAVTINVGIQSMSGNFSEIINFTSDQTKEDSENGIFYLEQFKDENKILADIAATGEKNNGKKAKGELTVYVFLQKNESFSINRNSAFTTNGLVYYATEDINMVGETMASGCADTSIDTIQRLGCKQYATISVEAAEGGTKYNIDQSSSWMSNSGVVVEISTKMEGGTDDIQKVITEKDIADTKEAFMASQKLSQLSTKNELFKKISDDKIVIESSFKQTYSEPTLSIKVDEEIKPGMVPTAEFVVTNTFYVIDSIKLEEFITQKAKIADSQKIYAINSPFVENFMENESGYTGKLKTSYRYGLKITDNEILESVKGRGLGDVQHSLKSTDGINTVKIDKSFPWVNTIPNDPGKITINLNIEGE